MLCNSCYGFKRTWELKLFSVLMGGQLRSATRLCTLVSPSLPSASFFFLVSCGSDGNLSYTSVSRAQISSEVRHYCVSDGTHCSADVCCAKSLFPPFKSNTKFFSQVLHGSTSTSSRERGPVFMTPPASLKSESGTTATSVVRETLCSLI